MSQYKKDIPCWTIPLALSYEELCQNSPLDELLGEENLITKEWHNQELDEFQKLTLTILRNEIKRKLR